LTIKEQVISQLLVWNLRLFVQSQCLRTNEETGSAGIPLG